MDTMDKMTKVKEYLDYVERHILNVQESWRLFQKKCPNLKQVWNDFDWAITDGLIKEHDLSKLSDAEFFPYQMKFYPVDESEEKKAEKLFPEAWEHHKKNNPHHWQTWTSMRESFPGEHACHLVCMVCDWMAMGLEFGDTAEQYYEVNKDKIDLPVWATEMLREIFSSLKAEEVEVGE